MEYNAMFAVEIDENDKDKLENDIKNIIGKYSKKGFIFYLECEHLPDSSEMSKYSEKYKD